MTQPRKKKPGPKRRTGRPATAKARAKNTAYLKAQREALREMGYVQMTVIVPAKESAFLRRRSQVNRLEGLAAAARVQGDEAEAKRQAFRLAALRLEHEAEVRAEQEAKAAKEREERRALQEWRRANASKVEADLANAKPSWLV